MQVQSRNNWQLPTEGKKPNKSQLTTDNCRTSNEQIDYVLEEINDLITRPDLKGWYAGAIRKLGMQRVLEMASLARQDAKTTPPQFFSYLLNTALKKHRAAEIRQPSTVLR